MQNDELLTEKELAKLLDVSKSCVQKWRRKGKGPPFIKVDEWFVRYNLKEVQEWIKNRTKKVS